ncbi:MAG: hypothetical protein IT371_05280 [Deltaproteobacteria bacterium]|nr:hypothetical protein [Deltaproteobacteria bacterium]
MRYRCLSCEQSFEVTGGDKPRCPTCLRQHGLEVEGAAPPTVARGARPDRRRRLGLVLAVAGVALGLGGAGFFWLHRRALPKPGELALLDGRDIARTLERRGVPRSEALDLFELTPELRRLVDVPRTGDAVARARGIASQLASRLAKVRVETDVHARGLVRTPPELVAELAAGKLVRATSFELATLVVTLLRGARLEAVLAEVHLLKGRLRAADPTGVLGRYVAVVYAAGQLGRTPALVLDPARAAQLPRCTGGRDAEMTSAAESLVPLDDASAAAHLLSLRALAASQEAAAGARAYELSRFAVAGAAPSPTVQMAQALVIARVGGGGDALAAARRAVALRDDAARRTALARLLLAEGHAAEAVTHLEQALKQDGTFFQAHGVLATVRWFVGEQQQGDRHLQAALGLCGEAASIQALQATWHLARGELDPAIRRLERVVAEGPSEQTLLQLYWALRQKGEAARATKVRERLLSFSGDAARARKALEAMDQALAGAAKGAAKGAGEPAAEGSAPPPALPPKLKLPDVSLGR